MASSDRGPFSKDPPSGSGSPLWAQALLDAFPDPVFLFTRKGEYVACHSDGTRPLLAPEEQLLKSHLRDVLPPALAEKALRAIEQAIQTGEMQVFEFEIEAPDGTRHEEARTVRCGDLALVVIRDDTPKWKAERALARERRLFESIVELNPYAIQIADLEGHFLRSNPAALRILPSPPPEYSFFSDPVLEREGVLDAAYAARDGHAVALREIWYDVHEVDPSYPSRRLCLRSHVFPIGSEERPIEHLVVMHEDVTARERALEDLREREANYRCLFESIPDAVYVQDRDGRFLDVNRAALETYGCEWEELIGETFAVICAPGLNDLDALNAVLQRAFAGERQLFEAWGRRRNGEVFPCEVRLCRGTYFGAEVVFGIARDISARLKAEEALRRAQKLESLGLLAGGIAHDFNNLLTAMLGNLHMAQLFCEGSPQARPFLENLQNAITKASALTRQLLTYSGKERPIMRLHDLNATVKDTADMMRASLPNGVTLELELAPTLPAVPADPAQLQRVVMNLLSNAADAIGASAGTIRVSTAVEVLGAEPVLAGKELRPGTYVVLRVADTGAGIPPDALERIFDPFFTTKGSGRGLGLSAMLGILRGHDAAVRIESAVGHGSTFLLFFPVPGRRAGAPPAEPLPGV